MPCQNQLGMAGIASGPLRNARATVSRQRFQAMMREHQSASLVFNG
jgi:hypothetical protein